MNKRVKWLALGVGILVLRGTTAGELEQGVRLKAGGQVTDINVGHLVPCAHDWNGDGNKDLIAGQFSGGRILLYLNRGTDAAPVLDAGIPLSAGGDEIRLSAG